MNEHATTLLTSIDPPQCSIDTGNHGILVLTGRHDGSRISPVIRSLGVRLCRDDNDNAITSSTATSFAIAPIFPANQKVPLSRICQRIRGLEERLNRILLAPSSVSINNDDPPLLLFQQACDKVFRGLVSALQLRQKEPDAAKTSESTKATAISSWKITSSFTKQLIQELDELQERYGPTAGVELAANLENVTLQYQDAAGRTHPVQFHLSDPSTSSRSETIDSCFPCAETDQQQEPGATDHHHRKRLRDETSNAPRRLSLVQAYERFCSKIDEYQALYNELDDIDCQCIVLEPEAPCPRNVAFRKIKVAEEVSAAVFLSVQQPRQLPERIRWIGRNAVAWEDRMAATLWNADRSVKKNLECCLGLTLPGHEQPKTAAGGNNGKDTVAECAICYADELEDPESTGTVERPDTPCDNASCGRFYHPSCLLEWLSSLPDSRISFDRILGTCPYCKQPLSAAMQVH